MSVSRRRFFKGLVGGLGSLGLANVLLSKQGWLGFFQPAEAHADIPPPYSTYTLNPKFYFLEGKRDSRAPVPTQDALDLPIPDRVREKIRNFTSFGPCIIEYSSPDIAAENRHILIIYDLTPSAAFITKLLLMGVDTGTLSQMYGSRFGVTAQTALTAINRFINSPNNFFQAQTYPAQNLTLTATESYRYPGHGPTKKLWADFSMGSVTYAGVIKYP